MCEFWRRWTDNFFWFAQGEREKQKQKNSNYMKYCMKSHQDLWGQTLHVILVAEIPEGNSETSDI